MKRLLLTTLLGVALSLGIVAPAAASAPRLAIHAVDVIDWSTVDWGKKRWESDGIEHVRGWSAAYETVLTVGGTQMSASSVAVVNWNATVEDGVGTMWGTMEVTLSGGAGGWHSTWVAKVDPGFSWSGWGIGRGWGSMAGTQLRYDVWQTDIGADEWSGYVFRPGS